MAFAHVEFKKCVCTNWNDPDAEECWFCDMSLVDGKEVEPLEPYPLLVSGANNGPL